MPRDRPSAAEPSRRRQLLVGSAVIALIGGFLLLCGLGRLMPGLVGEWFGMVVGILTTPLLMEASLFLLGLFAVLVINHWRRVREGDEFVILEQAEGPGAEALPEPARWGLLPDPAPPGEEPDLLTRAEGALEAGDPDSALECLALMGDDERNQPAALRVRIRLARATGRDELARRLEQRLDQSPAG